MINNLRTPGVYIQEVPVFPPSVAPVETAIPAFIGYTQRASFLNKSLKDKPVRISSMAEFLERYGGAPSVRVNGIGLDENNNVTRTDLANQFYLYDSLRLFFANGGRDCYILSVGTYNDGPVTKEKLIGVEAGPGVEPEGLHALALADEPTMILFPDAIALDQASDIGEIQKQAIAQCAELQDRVLVADVKIENSRVLSEHLFMEDINNFRQQVGNRDLKYAAAYYPYLRVNLTREFQYRDIKDKVQKLGQPVDWVNEFIDPNDAELIKTFNDLNAIIEALYVDRIGFRSLLEKHSLEGALLNKFNHKIKEFYTGYDGAIGGLRDKYQDILKYLFELLDDFFDAWLPNNIPDEDPFRKLLKRRLDDLEFQSLISRLGAIDKLSEEGRDPNSNPPENTVGSARQWLLGEANGNDAWSNNTIRSLVNPDVQISDAELIALFPNGELRGNNTRRRKENMEFVVRTHLRIIFSALSNSIQSYINEIESIERQKEEAVLSQIPALNRIVLFIGQENFLLPPSGAIAGVYASVDRTRGVWKAPANISLNAVVAPSVNINHAQQENLNFDVTAGKSVNAIRTFTGKGVLVWGARTLAGNDNEWRYISVRRFFNFVEESVKKATEPFVFEPNDENTWVKVRALIENFLIDQWSAGALQGARPEHAFFVKVGVPQTMTAQDILLGRMIVEIGMAVVRPAEFIVLKFMHKMVEES